MTWPEALLLGATALLLLALCLPARVRRPAVVSGMSLVALCAAAGLLTEIPAGFPTGLPTGLPAGPRWQWLPIAAGALLALALGALRLRGPRPDRRRGPRATAFTLALLACLSSAGLGGLAAWAVPVPAFPEPSGPHPVGVVTVQWEDPDREETWTDDPADHRVVVARVWYPASPDATGEPALYLGRDAAEADTVAAGLAAGFGVPPLVLSDAAAARAHALTDAPPAAGPHPVVLFSPGLGGVRTQNTVWAEGLASHGHIVVALDHPYDSAVVVLDDGTEVRGALKATGDPLEDDLLAREWADIRAADLDLALVRLLEADGGPLAGLADPDRVAVAGHSLGGAAALLAAADDPRYKAVINLDGLPRLSEDSSLPQPLLALVADSGTGSAEGDTRYALALDAAFAASDEPGYALTVPGTAHLGFSDSPFLLPPFPSLVGSLGREETARITEAACLAFLDASLNNAGTDVAAVLTELGEVTPMP
ncbi:MULTISPECIES: alpha/beta hydrolase family protein [unclassified Nocardiopsis]|uniref:alpha/beta hydrolase family protein n=1 Tax=Nocardiopsis TaxID=2013 RepID=UPI00387B6855